MGVYARIQLKHHGTVKFLGGPWDGVKLDMRESQLPDYFFITRATKPLDDGECEVDTALALLSLARRPSDSAMTYGRKTRFTYVWGAW